MSINLECPCGAHRYDSLTIEYEDDGVECPYCDRKLQNPKNDEKQMLMGANMAGSLQYPKPEVARAIAYTSLIYGMATHGDEFDSSASKKIEDQVQQAFGGGGAETVLLKEGGRAIRDMRDHQTGYMMVVVKPKAVGSNTLLYIVFRGSRSDTPASDSNPSGAGFSYTNNMQRQNVDYVANFSGRLNEPWWSPGVKVRRGFYELYNSMYYEINRSVAEVLNKNPGTQVIVTGHSLGAAMAVLCAHHLQCEFGAAIKGGGPFCFPFCTPRVGDFRFARHFKNVLASKTAPMSGKGSFMRCVSFCMDNDPVSNKGNKGYLRDHSDKDSKDEIGRLTISQGSRKANAGFTRKIIYGLRKKTDSSIQFYKTPNVYQFGWYALWNVHSYKQCQKKFLGKVLFTH